MNAGPSHFSSGQSAMLPAGTMVLGRYKIQRMLGRGGMGSVYLAQHEQTERLVALKFLDSSLSQNAEYVQRFRREARAAGRIRSEHVVAIYDLDADPTGGLVLVMEYLEGISLHDQLQGGPLAPAKALSFGRQLLEGLAAAHAASVIHRDLKPANLFLERSASGTEKLKILDFGISKLNDKSEQELTRAGQAMGTVAYMAPEQIRGKSSGNDPRADLYAAGVCIFMMLTGRKPIDAEDTVQLLAAVLEQRPLTLSSATGQNFSVDLEMFVAKALAKNPDHRFQTAMEMYEALMTAGRSVGYEPTVQLHLASVPQPFGAPEPSNSGDLGAPAPTMIDTGSLISLPPAPAQLAPATGSVTSLPPAVVASEAPSRKKPWMLIGAISVLAIVGAVVGVTRMGGGKSTTTASGPPATAAATASVGSGTPAVPVAAQPVKAPTHAEVKPATPAIAANAPLVPAVAPVVPVAPAAAGTTAPVVATNTGTTAPAATNPPAAANTAVAQAPATTTTTPATNTVAQVDPTTPPPTGGRRVRGGARGGRGGARGGRGGRTGGSNLVTTAPF